MEITISILSAFILGIFAFYFNEKKKWEKKHKQDRTMIEETKNIINRQKKTIENGIVLEKNYKDLVIFFEGLKKDLTDFERIAIDKKEELEYIAARSGLEKMDDGILFSYIKNEHKFSRTLLSNWLPYGMQLGKLDLLKKLKTHFK